MKAVTTPERAAVMKRAVYIVGGQHIAADTLLVTQTTVSRWCREGGPIPQAVILWAKQVIKDDDAKIAQV